MQIKDGVKCTEFLFHLCIRGLDGCWWMEEEGSLLKGDDDLFVIRKRETQQSSQSPQ